MEPTQILLFIVITALTVVLTLIGVQIFLLLRDIRKMFTNMNEFVTQGTIYTQKIAHSLTGFSALLTGLKAGLSVFNLFNKKKENQKNGQ